MTELKVSDPTSALQHSSGLSPQIPFGRRAFGPQRRMPQATIVGNIVDSIIHHRQLGQDRPISHDTLKPVTQALVQAKLETLVMASPGAMQIAN